MSRTGLRTARSSAQALPSRATPTVRWDNGSAATAPGLRGLGGIGCAGPNAQHADLVHHGHQSPGGSAQLHGVVDHEAQRGVLVLVLEEDLGQLATASDHRRWRRLAS